MRGMANDWLNLVWQDRSETGGARLVLLAIADRADDEGFARPGYADIAARANLGLRHTKRLVQHLSRPNGPLVVIRGGGRCNVNGYVLRGDRSQDQVDAAVKRSGPKLNWFSEQRRGVKGGMGVTVVVAKGQGGGGHSRGGCATEIGTKGDAGDTVAAVQGVTAGRAKGVGGVTIQSQTVTSERAKGDISAHKGCRPGHPNPNKATPVRQPQKTAAASERNSNPSKALLDAAAEKAEAGGEAVAIAEKRDAMLAWIAERQAAQARAGPEMHLEPQADRVRGPSETVDLVAAELAERFPDPTVVSHRVQGLLRGIGISDQDACQLSALGYSEERFQQVVEKIRGSNGQVRNPGGLLRWMLKQL